MSIADLLKSKKAAKAAANLAEGQAFLESNGQREGVITTPLGFQYEIITEGSGERPGAKSHVKCHYHGTLIDGRVFDSSVKRGQPATFPLNKVIAGWQLVLQMMPTGSKWKVYLPPHLAYAEQQVSAEIGPNSTLIFEIELLSFE